MAKRVRLSKQEKQRVTSRIVLDRFSLGDMHGTPEDVSRFIIENADGYDEYDDLRYESYVEYYQGGGYNEYLRLVGYKKETDEEYEERIEKLKETKRKEIERIEKIERATMKQLLKKYGNN